LACIRPWSLAPQREGDRRKVTFPATAGQWPRPLWGPGRAGRDSGVGGLHRRRARDHAGALLPGWAGPRPLGLNSCRRRCYDRPAGPRSPSGRYGLLPSWKTLPIGRPSSRSSLTVADRSEPRSRSATGARGSALGSPPCSVLYT